MCRMSWLMLFFTCYLCAGRRITEQGARSAGLRRTVNADGPTELWSPELGRFSKKFVVLRFVASGGQAHVWEGKEIENGKRVALRFPRGMCEGSVCFVHELDNQTLVELRSACILASAATDRFFEKSREKQKSSTREAEPPFAECLMPVSSEAVDPAFEVWTFAGEVTLADAFFTQTEFGMITIEQKRVVFETLREALATLADQELEKEKPCCCLGGNTDMCSTHHAFRPLDRLFRQRCPRGSIESPNSCGPIVHHDIKFDNIMVRRSRANGVMQPVLIDFGTATRCTRGQAGGFTRQWVPFWVVDPYRYSTSECWSYDTYGVGVAWLVTEILRDLHPLYLSYLAAANAGIIEPSCIGVAAGGLVNLVPECNLAAFEYHHEDIFVPIEELIIFLREHVLQAKPLTNTSSFVEAVRGFVLRKTPAGSNHTLPLTVPSEEILSDYIFPLLQECPSFPSPTTVSENRQQGTTNHTWHTHLALECRFRRASREMHKAITRNDNDAIELYQSESRSICNQLWSSADVGGAKMAEIEGNCDDDRDSALLKLVAASNFAGLRRWFKVAEKEGENIMALANRLIFNGESMLAVAARAGATRIVEFLLKKGASPFRVGRIYTSVASLPASKFGLDDTSVLQDSSFLPLPAVMVAATRPQNLDILSLLLNHAASQSARSADVLSKLHAYRDSDGRLAGPSLLSLVAESGDIRMLDAVIQELQPPNLTVALGGWVSRSFRPLVTALHGVDSGHIPLFRAAAAGQAMACRRLLEVGADPNTTDSLGRRPLLLAVQSENPRTVQILGKASGGVLDSTYAHLGTVFHVAAALENPDIVNILIDLRANASKQDTTGDTPLHKACGSARPNLQVVNILARHREAHRVRNNRGMTPLVLAAHRCASPKMFQTLLDTAPEDALELLSLEGHDAMMEAAAKGHLPCLRLAASRMSARSISAALLVAVERGELRAIEVLVQELRAIVPDQDGNGRPIAMLAGWNRHRLPPIHASTEDTLVALAKVVGDVSRFSIRDRHGMTVLGRWAFNGNLTLVRLLVGVFDVDCNSQIVAPRSVATVLGRRPSNTNVSWLTPLSMVRLRLGYAQNREYAEHWNSYADAGPVRRQSALIAGLLSVQRYLESLGCDPQQSQHWDQGSYERHTKLAFKYQTMSLVK